MMRTRSIHRTTAVTLFALTLALVQGQSQDRKRTQAFKTDRPPISPPLVIPSSTDAQLLESFALVQQANAGNAPAQHELGVRYLLGRGFPADTPKAIAWIRKSADQGYPTANFNLGVLEANGWGTTWDPFTAYRHFSRAANGEMPQALYIVGLIHGENFVVPRNWPVAYGFFKRAAEASFEPAKEVMAELERRGLDKSATPEVVAPGRPKPTQEAARSRTDTSFSFVFVDFTTDTVTVVPDTTLLREAGKSLHGNIDREEEGAADPMDSTLRMQVFRTADLGNPEALCVVGRLSERGIGVPRDPVRAGVAYLRAVRLDSYRAPGLLWKLLRSEEFLRTLRIRTDANDPDALFLWAGITALKFSQLLGEDQALRLLERAAEAGHVPSMIELGLCSYTGRWVPQDRAHALVWWEKAAAAGSVEGQIRVAIEQILAGPPESELPHITALLDAMAAQGVLIADVARAYCAERGIGRAQDKGEAYRIYHRSMRRGSELAFRALRRMHDDVRPPEEQFRLTD